jgi:drug/metabolite transporter (DMT)-like permease
MAAAEPPLSRGDVAILSTNLLWGTYWIPLRQMTADGGGTEATLWGYLAAGALMLPIVFLRWRAILSMPRMALAGVLVLALCLPLYSESLTRGQVARVLLLFYLTPIWSMIFAHYLLGVAITQVRAAAIALGLSGAGIMLGLDTGVPLPREGAEWMGLLAGILWGLAATLFNLSQRRRPNGTTETEQTALLLILLPATTSLVTLIPGEAADALAFSAPEGSMAYWAVAFAVFWVVPVIWLTLYGARRIDPARLGIFLLLDVVIGSGTAALLAGEPFGTAEAVGATLIVSAALLEAWSYRGERSAG